MGRFKSLEEMRPYIDPTFAADGDEVDSAFMQEVGLDDYEPGCIEAIPANTGAPEPLRELLPIAIHRPYLQVRRAALLS